MKQALYRPIFGILALVVLGTTGCTAEAKKNRHLRSADRYFAAGDMDRAEIEYLNALQLERTNQRAMSQLGIIYFDEGRLAKTVQFLAEARRLAPENLDVRIKLAQLFLSGGRVGEAAAEASFVLDHNPLDEQAPSILASAAANSKDADAIRERLRRLPPPAPRGAPVLLALGYLDLKQGRFAEANDLFERAEGADPKAVAPYLAQSVLYRAQRDLPNAERAFKKACDLSPLASAARIQYAQFKMQSGDVAGVRRMLAEVTQKAPYYLPAWFALAEIAASDKNYDECAALVSKVLERDPRHPEALLLDGRIKLARGDAPGAVDDFERDLKIYPRSPQFNYQLGLAYLASGDNDRAFSALNRTISLAPNLSEAVISLASLEIRTGDLKEASASLEKLVQRRPDLAQAWLLLADSLRGQGNFDAALAVYRRMQKTYPQDPQAYLLEGLVLEQQNNLDAARQAFSKALEVSPDYMPALEQLVNADLSETRFADATRRVEAGIAKFPKLAGPQLLMAKIFLVQKDNQQAEAAFKKAIELEPTSPNAYFLLARLYVSTKQHEKALASLRDAIEKNERDTPALLLTAMIQDQQKNYAAARQYYEKTLAIDPNSNIALNNLAYLYSEKFNEPEKAYKAAQRARQLYPRDPEVADTLGWIHYKRREYTWALSLLQESTAGLPTMADLQFHLGMTHYMMGEEDAAKMTLQRALELDPGFSDADEAKRHLAILAVDPSARNAEAKVILDKAIAEQPNDTVALARLAEIYASGGSPDKALDSWEAALKASPANVRAMMGLARLYYSRPDVPKAFEMAKAAHKLAPSDPEIGRMLGRLAFEAGDYRWSVSLLDEANRKEPDQSDVLFDLAEAKYSVGRVQEAVGDMQAAVDLPPRQAGQPFARAAEARRFLEMAAIPGSPARAAASESRVEEVLASNPKYVPALVARGAVLEAKADATGATQAYEKVLSYYPDFAPAMKRLTVLYAKNPGDDKRALAIAGKARDSYPGDVELARDTGIILYRLGSYFPAATALREAEADGRGDALLLFYLGMADYRIKARDEAKKSLQRALDLGLDAEQTAEARSKLAELK